MKVIKKENFISSLLYVLGGVLRDMARSYLKTKGILNENLSYHLCKHKEKKHETHFFPAKELTTKECDYLEIYFLPTMQQFLTISSCDLKFVQGVFWDDFLPIFYKQLDTEEFDQEDYIVPQCQLFHYISLFISDFVFFFLTNFCVFDQQKMSFNSIFSHYEEFMNFSLSFVSVASRNPMNMFDLSERKCRMLEIECEKTEYTMKDVFNHYGMCLIFFCFMNGHFHPIKMFDAKETPRGFLSYVLNRGHFSAVYQSCLYMIIKTENESGFNFMKDYIPFSVCFLQWMLRNRLFDREIDLGVESNKVVGNILHQFARIKNGLTDENMELMCTVATMIKVNNLFKFL